MAGPWFYRSSAAGTGDGLSWANARTTLATQTSVVAGDTIWVADDHVEATAGNLSPTFPGTAASPNFVYCADHTVTSPTTGDLKTTAQYGTTGGNNLTIAGCAYFFGIKFSSGNNLTIASTLGNQQIYDNCEMDCTAVLSLGAQSTYIEWSNTIYKALNAAAAIRGQARFVWHEGSVGGATVPASLITALNGTNSDISLDNLDLTVLTSGKNIFAPGSSDCFAGRLNRCKLTSGVVITTTPQDRGVVVTAVRCGTSAGAELFNKFMYQGTESNEATIIKTSGSGDGTSSYSSKIITTANSKWVSPFECLPIRAWVDTAGSSVSVTVYGTTTGGGVPNDDDIWIDIVSAADSGDPLGQRTTSTKANNLAASAATNNSADGSTWGGGGAGNGFKIVKTFTQQQKGPIDIIVKAAKATSTYYIDRNPLIA